MYLLVMHERTSVSLAWSLKTSGRKGLGKLERVWLLLKAFHYTAVLILGHLLLPISVNGAHASYKCICTET